MSGVSGDLGCPWDLSCTCSAPILGLVPRWFPVGGACPRGGLVLSGRGLSPRGGGLFHWAGPVPEGAENARPNRVRVLPFLANESACMNPLRQGVLHAEGEVFRSRLVVALEIDDPVFRDAERGEVAMPLGDGVHFRNSSMTGISTFGFVIGRRRKSCAPRSPPWECWIAAPLRIFSSEASCRNCA